MAKKTNRLSKEKSLYLQQHSTNPVDWFPWGKEAFDKAKAENKPIFLSIGYSACHWCHVMERESFENDTIAKLMNESFVNIKVDREERPDVDHIYMSAIQIMTHRGGWPLSVFLTPELEPFYGGTYFPPEDKMGMPGFAKILAGIHQAWLTKPDDIRESATELTQTLSGLFSPTLETSEISKAKTESLFARALDDSSQTFDPQFGGFGQAPKFFHTSELQFLLRQWHSTGSAHAREIATLSFQNWLLGGIQDHLGGGFHRYSTDARWFAPHFEKMLYDNALILELFCEGYLAFQDSQLADGSHRIADYILRDMQDPRGGFYSAQDADSEGVEGKYYVWTHDDIMAALPPDLGKLFIRCYNITPSGNWESNNILFLRQTLEDISQREGMEAEWLKDQLAVARRKLFQIRQTRVAPSIDKKMIVSWNAMMISALSKAFQTFGDESYLIAARKAALRIISDYESRGLHHVIESEHPAQLDDFSHMILSLTSLYQSDFNQDWLTKAEVMAEEMVKRFWEEPNGSFRFSSKDHSDDLIVTPREVHDGAVPSASAVAILSLIRLGRITQNSEKLALAENAMSRLLPIAEKSPRGFHQLLLCLDELLIHSVDIQLEGDPSRADDFKIIEKIRSQYLPGITVAIKPTQNPMTFYFCHDFKCDQPLKTEIEITEKLENYAKPKTS